MRQKKPREITQVVQARCGHHVVEAETHLKTPLWRYESSCKTDKERKEDRTVWEWGPGTMLRGCCVSSPLRFPSGSRNPSRLLAFDFRFHKFKILNSLTGRKVERP